MRNATATKHTPARANIRATATGGLRTGLSAMRDHTVAPVTVYVGGGITSLPATMPQPVQHPEPKPDPLVAKLAAAKAQAQAAELARQRRRNQRAANKAAKAAAKPAPAPVATTSRPGAVVSRHRSYSAAVAKFNATHTPSTHMLVASASKAYPWVIRTYRAAAGR